MLKYFIDCFMGGKHIHTDYCQASDTVRGLAWHEDMKYMIVFQQTIHIIYLHAICASKVVSQAVSCSLSTGIVISKSSLSSDSSESEKVVFRPLSSEELLLLCLADLALLFRRASDMAMVPILVTEVLFPRLGLCPPGIEMEFDLYSDPSSGDL